MKRILYSPFLYAFVVFYFLFFTKTGDPDFTTQGNIFDGWGQKLGLQTDRQYLWFTVLCCMVPVTAVYFLAKAALKPRRIWRG